MSPLSVSTILDPSVARFDLVIFDEASQVRPEDAIGSIMRGKQVIVVGDSMQLPNLPVRKNQVSFLLGFRI
jgi:superfamily I DNA and/or RNA helicase